jgi:hypothetical protein
LDEGATVSGGAYNSARGQYSLVAGGGGSDASDSNSASGDYSVVGGGKKNRAYSQYAAMGGGYNNTVMGNYATVGGGSSNTTNGGYATVGGGSGHEADGFYATVGGGAINEATDTYTTVSGGMGSNATGFAATVGGGSNNTASGDFSAVSGGSYNTASGDHSTIPGGGEFNTASGDYSFAAGRRAKANHEGAFVWADCTNADFYSPAVNSFAVRASGGVRFATTEAGNVGVKLDNGDTAWEVLCDSTKKTNRRAANTQEILSKVCQLPIEEWNYKHQGSRNTHIGPMAQEFYRLFSYGDDETSISTIDPDGIALAAIQELQKQNAELKKELNDLRSLVEKMATQHDAGNGKVTSAAFIPKTQETTLKEITQ